MLVAMSLQIQRGPGQAKKAKRKSGGCSALAVLLLIGVLVALYFGAEHVTKALDF